MDQWEKINALHRILSECKSYLTKNELIEKIACSGPTFYRLIKNLREQFNAPLVFSRYYKGYKYEQDPDEEAFELPGLWFRTDELEALVCLESLAETLQKGYLNDAFSAFRKRLKKLLDAQDVVFIDWKERFKIIPIAHRKTDDRIFQTCCDAVVHGKQLIITYKKLNATESQIRTISPQTLLRYKDNWYLDTWCHTKNALRTFALNRIITAKVTGLERKTIPNELLNKEYCGSYGIFSGQAKNTAEIRFTGIAACEIPQEEWHPDQKLTVNNDNSCTLKIPYNESRELIMDILRWGDEAKVIGPLELRTEIMGIIEKMRRKYRDLYSD